MDFNIIINWLLNLDPSMYVLFLGGAIGVSLLTQWIKKIFIITSEKHMIAICHIIALLASGLDYLLSNSHLPPTILGFSTVFLVGAATPIYIYIIKPLNNFINAVQAYKGRVLDKVEQINKEITPSTTPLALDSNKSESSTAIIEPTTLEAPIADF